MRSTEEWGPTGLRARLRDRFSELSPARQRLAGYLLEHLDTASDHTITELAEAAAVSIGTISQLCRRLGWAGGSLAGGRVAPRDADGVFRAARAGDPIARELVGEAAEALGRALAALAAVLDPARIAVGGAVGLGQPALVRRAATIARRRCIAETGRSLDVVAAALGDESVLAGAWAIGSDLAKGAHP
jgi:predicted NBD/HSP70 family sugar kinase